MADQETPWSEQEELFPETRSVGTIGLTKMTAADVTPAQGPPQARPAGWVLVGTKSGPQGYHRVRTASQNGSLLTVCGVVGRVVPDEATTIQPCLTCQSD